MAQANVKLTVDATSATRALQGVQTQTNKLQSAFGGLCFKNGNVDIDSWSDKDKTKVVNDQVKGLLNDIEDENIDPTTDEGKQQLRERIELLERWDSNNKSLKKLKDRYEV